MIPDLPDGLDCYRMKHARRNLLTAPPSLSPPLIPQSVIPGLAWPAIPNPFECLVLGLLDQFQLYERLPASFLQAMQFSQLEQLVEHAVKHVPWYQRHYGPELKRWRKRSDPAAYRRFPVLSRSTLQQAGTSLKSESVPKEHGQSRLVSSSGSTGSPVRVLQTELARGYDKALLLRHVLTHGMAPSSTAGVIRKLYEPVPTATGSAAAHGWLPGYISGPLVQLDISASLAEQAEWLLREKPAHLLSLSNNLGELARYCSEAGIAMPFLKAARGFGEPVTDIIRTRVREAFDVPVIDEYSTIEAGPIAFECPEQGNLHVCSETVYVEVLDEKGRACRPGHVGRVVVSVLHNFAMPLLRYELGDLAEVGAPCACGRGSPVLRRVLGRSRGLFTYPDGSRRQPNMSSLVNQEVLPIRQYKVVQTHVDRVRVTLVTPSSPSAQTRDALIAAVRRDLGYDFEVQLEFVDHIPRAESGKYEVIMSEVTP